MKYIVHKDVATWMRETYEVQVDNDCVHVKDAIINAVNGGIDDRIFVESAGTPEYLSEVIDMDAAWTIVKPKPKMTLETYVLDYLIKGYRGSFAASLAETWTRADSTNRRILEQTFDHIFTIPKDFQ